MIYYLGFGNGLGLKPELTVSRASALEWNRVEYQLTDRFVLLTYVELDSEMLHGVKNT